MATTATALSSGAWVSLGTTPCSVYNSGFGDILLVVDTSLPGSLTAASVRLPSGKTADIGIVGQNVYARTESAASISPIVIR